MNYPSLSNLGNHSLTYDLFWPMCLLILTYKQVVSANFGLLFVFDNFWQSSSANYLIWPPEVTQLKRFLYNFTCRIFGVELIISRTLSVPGNREFPDVASLFPGISREIPVVLILYRKVFQLHTVKSRKYAEAYFKIFFSQPRRIFEVGLLLRSAYFKFFFFKILRDHQITPL